MTRAGAALLAAAAAASLAAPAQAQFFSPGPLARPHSSLEGLKNCDKCHEAQKGLSARLCLDCHTELGGRVARGSGFHGRLPAAKQHECQSCHPDHRGKDFSLIEWEGSRDRFDHQKTGWPLRGGHAAAKVRCDDCHQRDFITDAAVRRLLDRFPREPTFLGVATRCGACHFDEHRGQLGAECQKCHDERAWKAAPSFNHQASAFPLKGKHKEVACAKCHPTASDEHLAANAPLKPRAATFLQMKPIDFKTCESCHEDPHKGSFGAACASCHLETGWKIVKAASGRDTGFHDKTRFPLRGGHVGVACRSCHGPFPGQAARFKGLPFAACSDCHEDAHLGQLAARPGTLAAAAASACDRCHVVAGFAPARYELEQHADTAFPLEGAHAATACRGCHPVDERLSQKIPAPLARKLKARNRPELFSFALLRPKKSAQECQSCHQDVHRGQLTGAGGKEGCAGCHTTTSFAELAFDHDKDSRFPLTGKHAQTPCAGCHKAERAGPAAAAMVRYKPLPTACGGCHADTHQGQFLGRLLVAANSIRGLAARPGKRRDCDACHTTSAFKQTTFDHNDPRFTSYALEGKHATVACARCHPRVDVGGGLRTVRYRPLPRACEACHTDFHHGAFRGFEP